MTTAIASLVTGNDVNPKIAMTGEVSLRGLVMPEKRYVPFFLCLFRCTEFGSNFRILRNTENCFRYYIYSITAVPFTYSV
nr:S16 family serine protease [Butyrivibrio sp. AE3004]